MQIKSTIMSGLALFFTSMAVSAWQEENMEKAPLVSQFNVNIIVETIEPSLAFWKAAGFDLSDSVPLDGPGGSGPLGFAILSDGKNSFMMQSVASIGEDMSVFNGRDLTASPVVLFLVVSDLDAIETRLANFDPVFQGRKTFYGSIETGYFTPDGTQVTFAEFAEPSP